jgi:hypothetical protein
VLGGVINAALQDTASVAVGGDLYTVGCDGIVYELMKAKLAGILHRAGGSGAYLVVLWCKLVQAFLNDVVTVEVLDKHNDMHAEGNDDRMDLAMVSAVSLQ